MKRRPIALARLAPLVLAALFASAAGASTPTDAVDHGAPLESLPVAIDPAHVVAGKTTFEILSDGLVAGTSVIDLRLEGDEIVIRSVATVEPDVVEDSATRLDRTTFAPLATEIRGRFAGHRMEADFRFEDGRVIGRALRRPAGGGEATELPVDMELPAGTFLRAGAIALLPAMPLEAGATLRLHWFNPIQAVRALVTLRVIGVESVSVPAGTFDAYRIEQSGDAPAMIFHVSTGTPRKLLRAEVRGEPMVLRLLPGSGAEPHDGDPDP